MTFPTHYISLCALTVGLLHAQSPPLAVESRWVGNTLPGAQGLVPLNITHLARSADGCFFSNAPWEEAGWNCTMFKDGKVLGRASFTHGWGNEGGRVVATNSRHLFISGGMGNEGGGLKDEGTWPPKGFDWLGVSRRPIDDIQKPAPFEDGKGGKGATLDRSFLVVGQLPNSKDGHPEDAKLRTISGLWATDEKLYVSCPFDQTIKVYDAVSMKQTATWKIANPGHLAMDGDGKLWMLECKILGKPQHVICLDAKDGSKRGAGIQLAPEVNASGLSINRKGRMAISDAGVAQRVLIYQISNGSGAKKGTLGVEHGIFSAPAGKVGPLRFNRPSAVWIDDDERITVAQNGSVSDGSSVLEQYEANGTLRWQLHGLTFVDVGEIDPQDQQTLYTREERFELDWKAPAERGWKYAGYTADPWKFPQDPRLHLSACSAWVRHISGKKFLFVMGMSENHLSIFKQAGEMEETFAPSGFFSCAHLNKPAWPPHQPAQGAWIWRDTNSNGGFDPAEYVFSQTENFPNASGWWVDSRGDVWLATHNKGIMHWKCKGLDASGNPIWDGKDVQTQPHVVSFKEIRRMRYLADKDLMILGGTTAEHSNQHWKPMGPVIVAYSAWSTEQPKQLWTVTLPYEKGSSGHSSSEPMGFDVAGDYLFVPYTGASKAMHVKHGRAEVLRLKDGSSVGHFEPSDEIGEIGLLDVHEAITTHLLDDGSYAVIIEDDYKAKMLMYHWKP